MACRLFDWFSTHFGPMLMISSPKSTKIRQISASFGPFLGLWRLVSAGLPNLSHILPDILKIGLAREAVAFREGKYLDVPMPYGDLKLGISDAKHLKS